MADLATCLSLCLLQPERSQTATNAIQFTIITGVFVIVIAVVMFYIIRAVRPKVDSSASDTMRADFEKSKEALLLAAQAKKAAREAGESAERQQDAEEQERELLKQNVRPDQVIGRTCSLSGLEMMADQELVIDPYSGQGYHFSAFLNDWPPAKERPKYVFRYPQGNVIRSADLIRGY